MISSGANDELERLRAENAALFEAHQACYLVFGKDDGKIRRANGKVLTHFGDRLRLGETRIRDLFVHSDAERVDDAMAEIVGSPSRRSVVNEAYFRPRDSLPVPVDIVLADFGIDQILMEVSHCPVGNGAKAAEPLLTKSGDVTARVLHDVRNLLFPLVGQVELAMASIEPESSAYAPLLEVIAACRRCESTLTQIEAITMTPTSPPSIIYTADLFERLRLVLRYTVSRNLDFDLQIADDTPPIRPPRPDFQRSIANLMSAVLQERDARSQVMLTANLIDARRVRYEFTIRGSVIPGARGNSHAAAILAADLGISLTENDDEAILLIDLEGRRTTALVTADEPLGRGETVLVLHTRPMPRDVLRGYLRGCGFEVETFDHAGALTTRMGEGPVSAIVAELETLPDDELDDLKTRFRVPVLSAAAQMQDLGRRIRTVLDRNRDG
ncbi:MAG: hypothetical protein KDB53_19770 [Planctomycetes bacterium]|nr:hypothetical protein [Planctomycetota bacterium]